MTCLSNNEIDWLKIDPETTSLRIESAIQTIVQKQLKRKGVVVGLSGGIDSSVVAALCTRALGTDRVLGLMMPERECSLASLRLGATLAEHLQLPVITEEITGLLRTAGCYARRDDAIRKLVPDFGPMHSCKLVTADLTAGARYPYPSLMIETPDGASKKVHLTSRTYLEIVAASNFKQRVRAMLEYYYADRLQYAVAGTPNRLEFDQGFFVKNGDGAADLKPIAHLYKSQVRQLAEFYNLPAEIRERPSTTDTFSLEQSQEEFYFGISLRAFDLCLYGKNYSIAAEIVADRANLSCDLVRAIYAAIESKRKATAYLHSEPVLIEDVSEIVGTLAGAA